MDTNRNKVETRSDPITASESPATTIDTAGVVAPPPLLYLAGIGGGVLLDYWRPIPFLPHRFEAPLAIALLLLGMVLFPAVRAFRRAGTRPQPWKPTTALVTTGPYRYSRNPMYLGFTLVYLGVTAGTNSGWSLVLLPVILVTMLLGVIVREEAYLERRFGDSYREYRSQVRRWL